MSDKWLDDRIEDVALAVHSTQMEGGTVSAAFMADARDYAKGLIDPAELVARARCRYGLDTKDLRSCVS